MCPPPRKRSTRQATKSAANGIKVEDDVEAEVVSTSTESKVPVKAGVSKRKVEEGTGHGSDQDDTKAKKRKTVKGGKKKDEEMRPLVARTVVESLKKGMYIGAHVSSAGGMSSRPRPYPYYGITNH